jgi:hypothetical protein
MTVMTRVTVTSLESRFAQIVARDGEARLDPP